MKGMGKGLYCLALGGSTLTSAKYFSPRTGRGEND